MVTRQRSSLLSVASNPSAALSKPGSASAGPLLSSGMHRIGGRVSSDVLAGLRCALRCAALPLPSYLRRVSAPGRVGSAPVAERYANEKPLPSRMRLAPAMPVRGLDP